MTHVGQAIAAVCATFLFGLLLLGWRQRTRTEISMELATLLAMFAGILFGVLWEVIEFVRDWVEYSDLQKSNTGTMMNFLFNDIGAALGALLATYVYCHLATAANREVLAGTAEWLVDGPSRVLDRHGLALTTIAVSLIAATVLTLWFAGRPVPGISIP
jgi:hypothetical protein